MLRITKVSEYGVLALRHIGDNINGLSAREISEGLRTPYEITAKTLQRLKEAGFVKSTMGTNGGYILSEPLSQISFARVIDALEGPIAIVECAQHTGNECSRNESCGLKSGMQMLNRKIRDILESTNLSELTSMENVP